MIKWSYERSEKSCEICGENLLSKYLKSEKKIKKFELFGYKECNHVTCEGCLREYIEEWVVNKGGSILNVPCSDKSLECKEKCPYDLFLKVASEKSKSIGDYYTKHFPNVFENEKKFDIENLELKDFNYYFKDENELRSMIDDQRFKPISEKYETMINEHVVKYIQKQIIEKYNFTEKFIDSDKQNNIFLSNDFYTNENKLIVVVQDNDVLPGQWSKKSCLYDSLENGSMLNFIKESCLNDISLIILNPNKNYFKVNEEMTLKSIKKKFNFLEPIEDPESGEVKRIDNSETPLSHLIFVYYNHIKKSKAENIYFVSHSKGSSLTMNLLRKINKDESFKKIKRCAFIDSNHSIIEGEDNILRDDEEIIKLMKKSINWMTDKNKINIKINKKMFNGCVNLSSGIF
jgi:hypothetical protein